MNSPGRDVDQVSEMSRRFSGREDIEYGDDDAVVAANLGSHLLPRSTHL